MKYFYDFSQDNEQEWLIEKITSHQWLNLKEFELEVRWMLGDTTWEPLALGCSPTMQPAKVHICTRDMPADLLMKVLPCESVEHHYCTMGVF